MTHSIMTSLDNMMNYPVTLTSVFMSNGGRIHYYIDETCQANETDDEIIQRAFDALEDQYDPVVQEIRYLITILGECQPLLINPLHEELIF